MPDENLTTNNARCKAVSVRPITGFVLFDQTHGTDPISFYSTWVNSLTTAGYVVDTLTSTPIDSTTFLGYDVFVIPQAHTSYLASELTAIQAFVAGGGGLLVIGDDVPSIYTDLTGFADIDWIGGGTGGVTTDITPHEVTTGVSSVALPAPIAQMTLGPSAISLVRDNAGGHMLVVSEAPGRVAGFADEQSLFDGPILQEDNLVLAMNLIGWLLGVVFEHDIAVTNLQASDFLEPGDTTLVNATIRNIGLNNETNIVVNFTVDGVMLDTTTIPFLQNGTSTPVSFSWTAPVAEGTYRVGIEAALVPDENVTTNNNVSKDVLVSSGPLLGRVALISDRTELQVMAPILDDIGLAYDVLDDNVIFQYTEDLGLLLQYQAVVYYTSFGMGTPEHDTLEAYIGLGGRLAITGFDSMIALSPLADLVRSISAGDGPFTTLFTVSDGGHPIMNGIYGSFPTGSSFNAVVSDHDQVEADTARGAQTVAELTGGWDKIIATELASGGIVTYWNGVGSADWTGDPDLEKMFKNLLDWYMAAPVDHDIAVVNLQAPDFLEPGDTTFVNATILNRGLNNETNILVNFTVDGVMADTTTIPFLQNGTSTPVSFSWTPSLAGDYTVCIEAQPVPDENVTTNNAQCKVVGVSTALRVGIYNHGTTADISYWIGGNFNLYATFQGILDSDPLGRFLTVIITDLSSSTLSNLDVLLLPDNAVPDIHLTDVSNFFANDKGIVGVDSAVTYLAYSGFLWPSAAGSNGFTLYWDYSSSTNDQLILMSHDVTEDYIVGNVYSSVAGDASMFDSMLPGDALALTGSSTNPNGVYVAAREDPGGGRVVELGPFGSSSLPVDLHEMVRGAVYWAAAPGPDTTPPVMAITSPSSGAILATSDVFVSWSASDLRSGIDRFEVSLDGGPLVVLPATATSHTFTGVADGSHTINITAYDGVGNFRTVTVDFGVDTTPPTVSISSPSSGAVLSSGIVQITWTATDSTSGVDLIFVSLDNEVKAALSGTASSFTLFVPDGLHTATITASDFAGNSGTVSVNFTVDTTPPTVSISSPSPGAFITSSTVEVLWEASDQASAIDRIEVSLDEQPAVSLPATATRHAFAGLDEGSHKVSVRVFDVAGHFRVAITDFVVDTTPPAVSVSSPTSGESLATSTVGVAWTASDVTTGIHHFEVTLDGGSPLALAATTGSHVFASILQGSHTITVTAFDVAGNLRTVSVDFTVDTTPPTIAITSPSSGDYVTSRSVEVEWTAMDSISAIDHFELRLDGGMPLTVSREAFSYTFLDVEDGSHTIRITAIDRAGNSQIDSVDIIVDTNPLSLTGPYGPAPLGGILSAIVVAVVLLLLLMLRRRRPPPRESGK